jgi:hypothetical protein
MDGFSSTVKKKKNKKHTQKNTKKREKEITKKNKINILSKALLVHKYC